MTEQIATTIAAVSIVTLLLAFIVLASGRARLAAPLASLALAGLAFAIAWRTYLPVRLAALNTIIEHRDIAIAGLKLDLGLETRARQAAEAAHRKTAEQWTSALASLNERLEKMDIVAPAPPPFAGAGGIVPDTDALAQLMNRIARSPHRPLPRHIVSKLMLLVEARVVPSVKRASFLIEAKVDAEIVARRRGTYYFIKPIDPTTSEPFVFPERLDDLGEATERLSVALDHIDQQILRDLSRVIEHEIYVIGSADALPFDAEWAALGRQRPRLEVLRRMNPSEPYHFDPSPHAFGDKMLNRDLPNLRAHRVASLLADKIQASSIAILDNEPHSEPGSRFRSVEIVLFVPW